MILQSSWKSSFVTLLRDLSGKDWNPREDRSLEEMRGFYRKKTFLEHSNEVLSRGHLHLVGVLYNISPLPSCSSSGVFFVKFNRGLFPRRYALFKRTRTKILLNFHESKGKEL